MTKMMMATVALVLAVSTGAIAQSKFQVGGPSEDGPGAGVEYVSWCQGDQVMMEDPQGEVVTKWDCSEISEQYRCVEKTVRKGDFTLISATCQ